MSPTTAVAAMNKGLLTFQRKRTASETAPISSVSQSPMAIRPSKMQAPRIVPIGRAISAAHKALHVRIFTVAREQWRCNQNENKRRKEDADGRDQRAPEAGDEIADEGRGNDDGTWTHQGLVEQYGWLDERQFLIAVAVGMLEKRHNHESAAKGKRSSLKKE